MLFNIFCDASIDTKNKIAISGAIITDSSMRDIIDQFYSVQYEATNNSAEIYAIYLGVSKAIAILNSNQYDNPQFRLFSDSKISIFGLKQWIYNWKIDYDTKIMFSESSNKEVSNQGFFKKIIIDVVNSNLQIEFLHQKGHVRLDSFSSLNEAEKVFIDSNGFNPYIQNIDIRTISYYNNMVDNTSRNYLSNLSSLPVCGIRPLNNTYIDYDIIKRFKNCCNNILYK